MLTVTFICFCALLLDRVVGEPRRWHPLVGFGHLAHLTESLFNKVHWPRRFTGFLSVLLIVLPWVLLVSFWSVPISLEVILSILIVYFAIGWQSLRVHALDVKQHLARQDLPSARKAVAKIVSRDTDTMTEVDVNKAVLESVLENANDAIFAPLFWFLVLGLPGVILYRCVNTLDAMWGYKTPRYFEFGWAAARLDDLLNYIPARLTALCFVLLGNRKTSWQCWQTQSALCESPNGGVVMTAGAGSLQIELGGDAVYHGKIKSKPIMGAGGLAQFRDIDRALKLIEKSLVLWFITLVIIGIII